ncbi:MAG: NUDIX domain-containing protein [Candidatus Moranbacteria bacterium]|nr:NUDIX domain-containing protein [Candidatus Moranbacteria bacterium]
MSDLFEGAITIFYRDNGGENEFLVVENSSSGNITFVGGAKEGFDESLVEVARRENEEELGIDPDEYELVETDVFHKFVFSPHKKNRVGNEGRYQVFVSDLSDADFEITPTDELKNVWWMSEEEVFDNLTFDDLKDVFERVLDEGVIA